jgi:hypothetical protein
VVGSIEDWAAAAVALATIQTAAPSNPLRNLRALSIVADPLIRA